MITDEARDYMTRALAQIGETIKVFMDSGNFYKRSAYKKTGKEFDMALLAGVSLLHDTVLDNIAGYLAIGKSRRLNRKWAKIRGELVKEMRPEILKSIRAAIEGGKSDPSPAHPGKQ